MPDNALVFYLLVVLIIASFAISLRLLALFNTIRKESRKSFEVASKIQEDWNAFSAREDEERRRLVERYDQFETTTRDRVDRFEKVADSTRERLIKLEQYLKEFFEVELKAVFDSFDKTVSSILEEMKSELLRGIDRIEDIQAFVDSKSFAQDRILEGEGSVYRLLADKNAGATPPLPDPAQPEQSQNAPQQDRADKPRYRLEPDEVE